MCPRREGPTKNVMYRWGVAALVVALLTIAGLFDGVLAAKIRQKSFTSPEEAVAALINAVQDKTVQEFIAIFGPEGKVLVSSGDAVADERARERFLHNYQAGHRLEKANDNQFVLYIGQEEWPFPIPLVRTGKQWRFDTKAGKAEVLQRRIGRNELSVIQVCLAYVDAQREYASKTRNGDGLVEYAQKVVSTPGKQDGLYWETPAGEDPSPLGPLFAVARQEGYTRQRAGDTRLPYHGYFYKILTAQGQHAAGGTYDYVVKGHMIGGFALVAYPAEYGVSGVMTFLVNHEGQVYQKDLGRQTATMVAAMQTYDPDTTWAKVP